MAWLRLLAAVFVALLPVGTALAQTRPDKGKAPPVLPPAPPAPPRAIAPPVPPAMAPAPPAPPSRPLDPARVALGRELADLLNGEAVTRIQSAKLFDETMPSQMAAQPEFAALEQRYPGIGKFVIARMRPVIERESFARLPMLIDRLGVIYAEEMSLDDLRAALAFYRSPAGRSLIRRVAEGWDMSSLVGAAIKDPDRRMTERDLNAAVGSAAMTAVADMPAPERAALMAFATSPAGRAIARVNPRVARAATDWANSMPPEVRKAVEGAASSAVLDYIQKYDAENSRKGAKPPASSRP